jgi:branched-chain amino acid transport system permease protein
MRGALLGAFAFALLQELFQAEAVFGSYAKHWHLSLGLTIMVCVAFMPHGLVALPAQLRARLSGRSNRNNSTENLEEQA